MKQNLAVETSPNSSVLALEKMRILVAEDNPVNQLIIQKTLERTGCSVLMVTNGFKVLEALRHQEFDLILMDCQMPDLDGFQTTKIIRKSKIFKNSLIPIIAVTANVTNDARVKCNEAGMNGYLPKPIDREHLYALLLQFLVAPSPA